MDTLANVAEAASAAAATTTAGDQEDEPMVVETLANVVEAASASAAAATADEDQPMIVENATTTTNDMAVDNDDVSAPISRENSSGQDSGVYSEDNTTMSDLSNLEDDEHERFSPSLLCNETIAFPLPGNNALVTLYDKLIKLIECPVCLDLVRPGCTTIGACNNGHIVCPHCAVDVRVSESGDEESGNEAVAHRLLPKCPVCRSRTFNSTSRSYLAITLVDALTDCTVYRCRHTGCNTSVLGKQIIQHEHNCALKPFVCPRQLCNRKIAYKDVVSQKHDCVALAEPVESCYNTESFLRWKRVIEFDEIFSFDTCCENITELFKPIALLPLNPAFEDDGNAAACIVEEQETRRAQLAKLATSCQPMFVGVTEMANPGGIMFYISSLRGKDYIIGSLLQSRFLLSAYIHPPTGRIGPTSSVRPTIAGSTLTTHSEGLYLSRADLVHFITLMMNGDNGSPTNCSICSNSRLHLHLEVTEEFPKI